MEQDQNISPAILELLEQGSFKMEDIEEFLAQTSLLNAQFFNFFFLRHPQALKALIETLTGKQGEIEEITLSGIRTITDAGAQILDVLWNQDGNRERIYLYSQAADERAKEDIVRMAQWNQIKNGSQDIPVTIIRIDDQPEEDGDVLRERVIEDFPQAGKIKELRINTALAEKAQEPLKTLLKDLKESDPEKLESFLKDDLKGIRFSQQGKDAYLEAMEKQKEAVDSEVKTVYELTKDLAALMALNQSNRKTLQKTLFKNRNRFEKSYPYLQKQIEGVKSYRDYYRDNPVFAHLMENPSDIRVFAYVLDQIQRNPNFIVQTRNAFSNEDVVLETLKVIGRAGEHERDLQEVLYEMREELGPVSEVVRGVLAPYSKVEEAVKDPMIAQVVLQMVGQA